MNKTAFLSCIVCLVIALFTGCATIITGTSDQVTITSDPPDARVMIYNRSNNQLVRTVQTPAVLNLPKNRTYRFVVEKDGFQQERRDLGTSFNPWFLGSLTFGTLYFAQAFTEPPYEIDRYGNKEYTVDQGPWTTTSLVLSAAILAPDLIFGGWRRLSSREHVILRSIGHQEQQQTRPTTPSQPVVSPLPIRHVGIEGAVERAVNEAFRNVPQRARIAIVQISVPDTNLRAFVSGEVEHIVRRQNFRIVDRVALDRILEEQTRQIGGDFDERTAVNIGRLAGADLIVTGSIDGEGALRRLRLRVIEVETSEIVGTASEPF
ncbi:MAG: penicillin-binding protein activator LpoB [Candidatus Cloacimonetes bacterium]|nr:penicillin-binding protein activator LpoB [Candidatus Cloacimonadota bacterium]